MEPTAEPVAGLGTGESQASIWRSPTAWLKHRNLSRGYWIIFAAALFFNFGFSLYAFQFNLYLADLHFTDRWIGLIGGAATLGHVCGLLPAGMLSRRIGLRPVMIVCFLTAPLLSSLRSVFTGELAQLGLAFFAGVAVCLWGVCYLPAAARFTTTDNRATGYSLVFASNVAATILGGVVCGYLPQWLHRAGFSLQPSDVKRLILIASCAIAALGLFPVLKMRIPRLSANPSDTSGSHAVQWRRLLKVDPFLLRFLPAMGLWTVVLTSFSPFGNVYLTRNLHVPQLQIGLTFSAVQFIHLFSLLLTPMLFRAIGLVRGIIVTQMLAATLLICLAGTQHAYLAVVLYLAFDGVQWMSSPGLYTALMNHIPEEEHSAASSITLFCTSLVGAGATAGAGILFTKFGYPHVLVGIATVALGAALLFRALVGPAERSQPSV